MPEVERIAIFGPSFRLGGAEKAIISLANGFFRQGKTVYLLLASAQGQLQTEVDPGVKVVDFRKQGVFSSIFPLSGFLRRHRPDVLLSAQSHANVATLLARKVSRVSVPVVINEQTIMSVAFVSEPGIKNKLVPRLARLIYRQADAVVCISQGLVDDILEVTKISPRLVYRIYNPVLPPDVELQQKIAAPLDHAWFRRDSPPVILAVGRLTAAKDYPTLLRAFALARQKRAMNLLILGEGEKRAEIESLVQTLGLEANVQLPGSVDNPYRYMARCTVFALSSAFEGLANVLVEALACGAAIVATDCQYGPAEILEQGRYGILVPVGDVPGMAQAILGALDRKREVHDLRERARVFSQENAVQEYLALFLSLNKK